jgi:hypothetical protein
MTYASAINGSGERAIPVFVVCRSQATAADWIRRAAQLPGLDVRPLLGVTSYYKAINELLQGGIEQPVLLVHDDIRCGFDFAVAVRELLVELEQKFTNWGVCGNAGIFVDGQHVLRHLRDPHGGPDPGTDITPVLVVDGNTLLLNVPALRQGEVRLPDFEGFHGYDVALSIESWLAGLAVFCDRRLFVMHKSGGDQIGFDRFCKGPAFTSYLASRLINTTLPTLNGLLDLGPSQTFRHLDYESSHESRKDISVVFDDVLSHARRTAPFLTIICRTQLVRPELLERAMSTFAMAAVEAGDLVQLEILVASDRPHPEVEAATARLREQFPGLALRGIAVAPQQERFSRVGTLFGAIMACQGDYIWVVDDDDFVFPLAVRPIARWLAPGGQRLIVGHARRFEEHWSSSAAEARCLKNSIELEKLRADGVFHAFDGDNHTPVCSAIFPLSVVKERLSRVAARGDYYEDYFLLMLTLTSARVEVICIDADIAGISLRPGENTVTLLDREHWDMSYATFMNELLRLRSATSPLFWQLAHRPGSSGLAYSPSSGTPVSRRLSPSIWPLLFRRTLFHLQKAGWRATVLRIINYLRR